MVDVRYCFAPNPGAQSEFLTSKARYPALFMGQGGGKTWAGAVFIVRDHCNFPETDSLCVAPTFPLLRQITIPAILERFAEIGIVAVPNYSAMEIVTPQLGSKVVLHSGIKAERITGFEVGRAWIDEPARIPDYREPQRHVWYNAVARARHPGVPHDYHRVAITGTHEGKGTWVYRDWEGSPRPGTAVFRGTTRENPVNVEYAKTLVATYGAELAEQYVEGGAIDSNIGLLSWDDLLAVADPSCPREPDWFRLEELGKPLYAGVDIGRKKSLTVCWVCSVDNGKMRTEAVIELSGAPFAEQIEMLNRVAKLRPMARISIDATYNPQTAEDLLSWWGEGMIDPVVFTSRVKVELCQALAKEVQAGLVTIPDADDVLMDLFSMKRIVTSSGAVSYTAPYTDDGHADRFIALALCIRAAGQGDREFGYEASHKVRGSELKGVW